MTVADLARWFDRPDPSVRCWARGSAPAGTPKDLAELERMLHKLEVVIGKEIAPFPLGHGRGWRIKAVIAAREKHLG